ncbi:MAG: uracil-DNA glycosylase [Thermaerobacter sp.]|nr:uracil-DNA glycosylase [Thermaerobacter sp.]
MAAQLPQLTEIGERIVLCRACPRLVKWREEVARVRVRRHRQETYWGRPLPGFGDPGARLLVVGLAPAAHGGNRTGRMFTGDDSADWLVRELYEAGFANQPTSLRDDDGLVLRNAWITAAVRCAPPANRPAAEEIRNCAGFLAEEVASLQPRVLVALGRIAFDAVSRLARGQGAASSRWRFGHGVRYEMPGPITLLGSYHPSRQNTQTGRLTREMLRAVFAEAREILREAEETTGIP